MNDLTRARIELKASGREGVSAASSARCEYTQIPLVDKQNTLRTLGIWNEIMRQGAIVRKDFAFCTAAPVVLTGSPSLSESPLSGAEGR